VAVIFTLAAWSCTVMEVLAVGQALGIQLTVGQAALLVAGIGLATAIPSGPGYIGVFEFAGQTVAMSLGMGASEGLVLTLVVHVLAFAVGSLGGALSLAMLGQSRQFAVGQVVGEMRGLGDLRAYLRARRAP
jgi:hypothetical protein